MACTAVLADEGSVGEVRDMWLSLSSKGVAAALAAPVVAKSPHFVLHHLPASPGSATQHMAGAVGEELFTDVAPSGDTSVDKAAPLSQWWLGLVIPKRHAKRAVTRTLLKRQARAQAAANHCDLPPGLWVVRLRAPFARHQFPSAASAVLSDAARGELAQLFAAGVVS
jgi:ribonuclease P protein component